MSPSQAKSQQEMFRVEEPAKDTKKRCAYLPVFRVTLVREKRLCCTEKQITGSRIASQIFFDYLDEVDREHFVVILLDRKNKVIGINTVSIGSLTASIVHPREVFKPAIVANASSIICGHNHPSGDPQPSGEDRTLTTRLAEAGKLLGVSLLDHVIIGDGTDRYFSFADEGLL